MKPLPPHRHNASLVLRTDFSDDAAWNRVCKLIQEPQTEDQFRALVDCVSDPAFEDMTAEQLAKHPGDHSFIFIADWYAFGDPESSVLVLDRRREVGRTFRVIPSEAWGVQNNLSISNMDFREFADSVDEDGVFRGFPE